MTVLRTAGLTVNVASRSCRRKQPFNIGRREPHGQSGKRAGGKLDLLLNVHVVRLADRISLALASHAGKPRTRGEKSLNIRSRRARRSERIRGEARDANRSGSVFVHSLRPSRPSVPKWDSVFESERIRGEARDANRSGSVFVHSLRPSRPFCSKMGFGFRSCRPVERARCGRGWYRRPGRNRTLSAPFQNKLVRSGARLGVSARPGRCPITPSHNRSVNCETPALSCGLRMPSQRGSSAASQRISTCAASNASRDDKTAFSAGTNGILNR